MPPLKKLKRKIYEHPLEMETINDNTNKKRKFSEDEESVEDEQIDSGNWKIPNYD